MATAITTLSAIAALAAALLWFASAVVKTPKDFSIHVVRPDSGIGQPLGDPLGGTYMGHAYSDDLVDLANALRRQSKLSGWAASLAGVSALLQVSSLFLS